MSVVIPEGSKGKRQAARYGGEAVTRDNQLTQHGGAGTVCGNLVVH
jgi:hypothetical protein